MTQIKATFQPNLIVYGLGITSSLNISKGSNKAQFYSYPINYHFTWKIFILAVVLNSD